MFYVYLLQSEKDKSFYIGQCEDIFVRLERHNAGYVASTKKQLPWNLIGYEEFSKREKARWREYQLKNSFSKKKRFIEKLMSS